MLEDLGYDLNHPLWTANLLETNPNAIIQAHLTYLNAGAQCITTASYQANILGLIETGFTKDSAVELILKSVQLAKKAIQLALENGSVKQRPLIAASIGPYGAYLADGSEYRGNYGISDTELHDFHFEKIQILDTSNADFLAFETIPSLQEAHILSELLLKVNTPSWISFSCKNAHELNDGSKLIDVVALFQNHPNVFAVGVNCTPPKYLSEIIRSIKESNINKKVIVYPNSGEAYHAETKTWLGVSEPISFAEMCTEWIEIGADIVGGCCRIGPDQIKSIQTLIQI